MTVPGTTRRSRSLNAWRPIRHLYFHIPFCPKLCPYCSFYVETGAKNKTTAFLDALLREVDEAKAAHELQPRDDLLRRRHAERADGRATRLPARRPARAARSERAARSGTSRRIPRRSARRRRGCCTSAASRGSASACNRGTTRCSRRSAASTTPRRRRRPSHVLRDAGFDNINIDLMFAVPGQTLAQWQATLAKTIALQPGACLVLLPHLRGRHRLLPQAPARHIPAGRRPRRRPFRDDDGHAHRRRLRPLRDLQLRAARPRIARTISPTGAARITSASARAPSPPSACAAGRTSPTPPNTRAASSPAKAS